MANNNSNLIEKLLGGSGLNQVWVKVFSLVKILTGDVDVKNKGNLQKQIDDVRSSVENMGKNQARVFQTVDELDTWLEEPSNVAQLTAGDNFYIVATDVPDYWWDGTQKQPLEGQKVDLSTYDQEINKLNEDIDNLQSQMTSFEATKSDIVSSSLGQVIGLTASSVWSQIVEKIKSVVNRGALNWSGNNTTYSVQAGYYSGGNLDSRPSYNNGYNAGVAAADGRVNTGSASYTSGYNAGVNASKMGYATLRFSGKSKEFISVGTYTATRSGTHLFVFNKVSQNAENDMDGQALLNGQVISSFEGAAYSGSSSGNTYAWKFAYNLSAGQVVTFQLRNHYSGSYTMIIDGAVSF